MNRAYLLKLAKLVTTQDAKPVEKPSIFDRAYGWRLIGRVRGGAKNDRSLEHIAQTLDKVFIFYPDLEFWVNHSPHVKDSLMWCATH